MALPAGRTSDSAEPIMVRVFTADDLDHYVIWSGWSPQSRAAVKDDLERGARWLTSMGVTRSPLRPERLPWYSYEAARSHDLINLWLKEHHRLRDPNSEPSCVTCSLRLALRCGHTRVRSRQRAELRRALSSPDTAAMGLKHGTTKRRLQTGTSVRARPVLR